MSFAENIYCFRHGEWNDTLKIELKTSAFSNVRLSKLNQIVWWKQWEYSSHFISNCSQYNTAIMLDLYISLHKNIKLNKWLTYVKKWSLHYSSSYCIVILHSLLQGKIFYEVWFHFFLFVVHAFDIRSKNFFTLNVYEVYIF